MIWTVLFLAVVGALLPLLAFASWRQTVRLAADAIEMPSSTAIVGQALLIHAVVLSLALASAASTGLQPVWFATPTTSAVGLALATLAAFGAIALYEIRRPSRDGSPLRERLSREGLSAPWLAVSVSAAIAEEAAYRGVLFLLLASAVHPLAAAISCAVLFALGHLAQGPKAALLSGAFALVMHGLYELSGALLLPIVVHFFYDAGVAFAARRITAGAP